MMALKQHYTVDAS